MRPPLADGQTPHRADLESKLSVREKPFAPFRSA